MRVYLSSHITGAPQVQQTFPKTSQRKKFENHCCSELLLHFNIHWSVFLERHNISVILVLIFIPARSHAAEIRSSAC